MLIYLYKIVIIKHRDTNALISFSSDKVTVNTMFIYKIFIIFTVFTTIYTTENNSGSDGGFLFTVPRALRSGKKETACLSLHGQKIGEKVDVTVNIETTEGKNLSAVTKKSFDAENIGCFEVRIPDSEDSKAKLHLQIKFSNESNSINSVEDVHVVKNTEVTFIQTDKEIYKPGDRVKIRILILNHELGVPKNSMIPIVKIRNPSSIAIGQWENVTTDLGLVQLEHQLSQETVTGLWRIELPGFNNDVAKTFEVKPYVLPRFEVIINHDENIYHDAESYNVSVCAKYSYGRFIKGTTHLKAELMYQNLTVNQIKELKNGCSEFTIQRSDLPINKDRHFYYYSTVQLTATVTEHGTSQMQTKTSDVYFTGEKYNLEFVKREAHFQPGIPYKDQVKINNKHEDLTNKSMQICYNSAVSVSYNYTAEQCKNITLNGSKIIDFTILPFHKDAVHISIHASLVDTTENATTNLIENRRHFPAYSFANARASPSNSYIHINYEPSNTPLKCKAWQSFTILYTVNTTANVTKQSPITFNYLIISKGNLVKFGKVSHTPCSSNTFDVNDYTNIIGNATDLKPLLPIDKLILTIKISQKMFSGAELIVYYVKDDGEVVGSSIKFDVENCLANKVEANWSEAQNYPGEKSIYKIKTSAGSLCAISAVDKKVSLLKTTENLKIEELLRKVEKPFIWDYTRRLDCVKDPSKEDAKPYWDLKRKKRSSYFYPGSDYYDTFQVFRDSSLIVMTDLKIITRPCYYYNMGVIGNRYEDSEVGGNARHGMVAYSGTVQNSIAPAAGLGGGYDGSATDNGVPIRSYFPETWLWELVPIGSGEIQLEKELPHSITKWLTNTICVSPTLGIGISPESVIKTFKPFFIDVITPYSIKRNEVSHFKIIVHNYLNHSLPVGIKLGLNDDMELAGSPEESFITACIGPSDSITDTFRVIALGLGKLNYTITAEVDSAYPGECGPEILVNRKDVIENTILVQPEGFPVERTLSNFVCANDTTNNTAEEEEMKWNIEVPFDSIKNSSRLKVLLDADILGLTIENLGSLLNIPTGCGEQIMSTLAPNMYILRYLKSTGNLSSEIEEKTVNYIKIGYERIMKYRHRDGSFSAFGEKHGNGSMFLTAFVLRTLSQAADYIYVDKNILTSATGWILEKQFENGCFPSVQHVFHSISDDKDQENIALTAYVLISLLESGMPISEKVRDNAKFCLRGYNSDSKYTMAIITYALSLVNWESEASRSLDRMIEIADRKNGLLWWDDTVDSYYTRSVEMTAYMILSLIHTNDSQKIALAHEAVRWLLTKRNPYGGFISTQDTVVALDALTKFASVANKEHVDLTVSVATGGKQLGFRMRSKAKLKTKQIVINKFSNFIKFKVNGTGCILIQTNLRYNMAQMISSEALKLAVSINPVSTIDKCTITQVKTCFSYTVPNKHINMAVLEISLPSGYRADRSSLYGLLDNDSKVQRFEEIDDKVVLYFTEVNDEKLCVPFLINEESFIENRTSATVKLYDYYNPEVSTFTSYELTQCSPVDLSS